VNRLKSLGYWVRGVDIKYHEYKKSDMRDPTLVDEVITSDLDEVYQLFDNEGTIS